MSVEPGSSFGPYTIRSQIGEGGMGQVYLAEDTRLNRKVAIKVLHQERTSDPEAQARFTREARVVASLSHPRICALFDVGRSSNGAYYLVMEYLPGETLQARLARAPLPLHEAMSRAIEILEGLEVAHRAGVIHRDLKPGNVMLTASGAKLLDFGIARRSGPDAQGRDPTHTGPLTLPYAVLGTPQYMAPEQLEGRAADPRTDLFAFGALFYEMLTGRRPFAGSGPAAALAILQEEPAPVSAIRPASPALDRLVARALAKNPEERWQTATDLLAELRWLHERTSAAGAAAEIHTLRFVTTGRRWFTLGAGFLAGALTVSALAAAWRWSAGSAPAPIVRFAIPVMPVGAVSFGGALGARLALSPDGRLLVYVAEDARGSQLYVRAFDSAEALPLPNTGGATSVFFSPAGDWVGFFGGGKLKKTRLQGGSVVTICDAIEGVGASWGRDDVIVFAPSPASPLFRVPSGGGTPEPLTTLIDGETSHRWPEILPSGDAILFAAARGSDFTQSRIFVQSLSDATRRELVPGTFPRYSPTGHLLFARDSSLLAAPFDPRALELTGGAVSIVGDLAMNSTTGAALLAFASAGTLVYRTRVEAFARRELVWVSRDGSTELVTPEKRAFLQPRLSPDGRRIAVSIGEVAPERDVWVYDLERRTLSRLTDEPGEDETPIWSPDGTRIAISAARADRPRIIFTVSPEGGAKPTEIATARYITHLGSWTADAALLWTEFDPETGGDIRLLSRPQATVRTVIGGRFDERSPAVSPNGTWMAYTSTETGRDEVFVQALAGPPGKWPVSTDGGSQPAWSVDGRTLYYRGSTNMMAVAVADATPFSAGPPQPLFPDDYDREHRDDRNYDVAADGRFLMLRFERPPGPPQLNVVLNWSRELVERSR